MRNIFTPFPRYENAVIVGDRAAETLAALRIYGRGLIGGDIPSMEVWHPTEKMLECTHCVLHDRARILDAGARRIAADYILLEDNGVPGLNPAVMKDDLEKAGFSVRVLDVQGHPLDVIDRAAELYGEQAQARRIRRDYEERLACLRAKPALSPWKVLVLLGIRHPVEDAVYCMAATTRAEITPDVLEFLGCANPLEEPASREDVDGMVLVRPEELSEMLLRTAPDAVALTGDAAAAQEILHDALVAQPGIRAGKALRRGAVLPLPWHCRPMDWRRPRTLEVWHRALASAQKAAGL